MPTNGMTIDSLNTVSSLTAQDEVPVWDKEASGEPTRKITAQNMANSVKSLASLPNTTEMNTAIAQSTAFTTELDIANAETGYTIVSSEQRNFGVLHQIFVRINKNGNTFSANEEGKTLAKIDGTFYGTTQCIMAASNMVNYLANRYVSVSFYSNIIRLDSLLGNADIKEIAIIGMYIR